jgi:hypothetical protein
MPTIRGNRGLAKTWTGTLRLNERFTKEGGTPNLTRLKWFANDSEHTSQRYQMRLLSQTYKV